MISLNCRALLAFPDILDAHSLELGRWQQRQTRLKRRCPRTNNNQTNDEPCMMNGSAAAAAAAADDDDDDDDDDHDDDPEDQKEMTIYTAQLYRDYNKPL